MTCNDRYINNSNIIMNLNFWTSNCSQKIVIQHSNPATAIHFTKKGGSMPTHGPRIESAYIADSILR